MKYENCGGLQWANRYGGSNNNYGSCITLNNSYVIAGGYYLDNFYGFQLLTLKYNTDGSFFWNKNDGNVRNDYFFKVVTDNSGNIYLGGNSAYNNPGETEQMILKKYDANGNTIWTQYYGALGVDNLFTDLAIDNNNNLYIIGGIGFSTANGADFATVKYNSSGSFQWAATYNGTGNSDDVASSIIVDNNGNVYITGESYEGPITKNAPSQNVFTTIKYNSSGVQQWLNKYFGMGTNGHAGGNSITINYIGDIYVTGFAHINSLFNDYVTIKYSPDGAQQWLATYDNNNGNDAAKIIKADYYGIYVTGLSNSNNSNDVDHRDYATIKYDMDSGLQQWVMRYDGAGNKEDNPSGLSISGDGSINVTGKSIGVGGDFDYLTIRYSTAWPVCNPGGDINGSVLNSTSKLNDSTAITVGEHGTILKTSNFGLNWSAVSNNNQQRFNKVHFLNANTGIISGDSGTVLYTTNSGNNWISRNAPFNNEIKSTQLINSNLIYAIGLRGLILKTTNAGNTWVNLSIDTSSTLHSVHFTSPSKGFAAGGNGLLLRTANSGGSWTSTPLNTTNDLKKIQFSDSLNGVIVGNSGTIFVTTNGGNNWSSRRQPQFNNDLNDVYFVSKDTIYIAGNGGMILCSNDRGRTWKQQNTSVAYNLQTVLFWNNNRGMAAGDNGNIILTSLGERYDNGSGDKLNSLQHENSAAKEFKLQQNYPNPFNPQTNITYSIPKFSRIKLIIYDLLGQEISILVNGLKQPGSYKAIFNASNLPSGVYFYKLIVYDENGINEDFSLSKKMILIK